MQTTGTITAISNTGIKLNDNYWYNLSKEDKRNLKETFNKEQSVSIEYTQTNDRKIIISITHIDTEPQNNNNIILDKDQRITRMNVLQRATEIHNQYYKEINLDSLKEIADTLLQWVNNE